MIKDKLKNYLKSRGFYQKLLDENIALTQQNKEFKKYINRNKAILEYRWIVPPGHYYSPLVDEKQDPINRRALVDLRRPERHEKEIPGIKLIKAEQLDFLKKIKKYLDQMPDFSKRGANRYHFENDQFGKSDGVLLFLMLRALKPSQIIEIGSGWSSALMLDINERFPQDSAKLIFIEPNPERLYSVLKNKDKQKCQIIAEKVQCVKPEIFQKLQAGDVLFIDSSHVVKTGSDVNYLLFEILPRLKKGVIVHIHDILYPFEYLSDWVIKEKRNWNEVYAVKALLMGDALFDILLWQSYLVATQRENIRELVPELADLSSSIWLKKK